MDRTYQPLGIGVGTLIDGRYELLERLGSGANSAVFKAMDRTLRNDLLALKLFSPSSLSHEPSIERIYQEALYTRKLTHPNIIRTYDLGKTADGQHYLTMEFVSGSSLDRLIHGPELHRPDLVECIRILAEVAQGLSHAHAQGIIHRDMKPANVLIGVDGRVKIADFGLARAMYPGHDLTQAGECVGTPYYMAPEQIQDREVDGRTDVYALGIIAFELITGRVPFHETSWFDLAQRILSDPTPDFTRTVRVPDWLSDFVFRATQKLPEARYDSVDEVVRLFEEHRGDAVAEPEVLSNSMLPKVLSLVGIRLPSSPVTTSYRRITRDSPKVSNTALLLGAALFGAIVLGGSLLFGDYRGTESEAGTSTEFISAASDFVKQMREGAEFASEHREDLKALLQNVAQTVRDAKNGKGTGDAAPPERGISSTDEPEHRKISNEEVMRQLQQLEDQLRTSPGPKDDKGKAQFADYLEGLKRLVADGSTEGAKSIPPKELERQLLQLQELQHQLEQKLQSSKDDTPPKRRSK